LLEYQSCDGIKAHFTTLCAFIEKSRSIVAQDSYLQNQIDEMVAEIHSLLYKLRFLK